MRKLGECIANERNNGSWQQKLLYQFPPRMSPPPIFRVDMENIKGIPVKAMCEYKKVKIGHR